MDNLRIYEENTPQYHFYNEMHKNQTLDYVMMMKDKYLKLNNKRMSIKKVLSMMDTFIDPSDPDLDSENSITYFYIAKTYSEESNLIYDKALSVELPSFVELKIESTDAAIKGQTASSSYKPATLENGINIMVPPFIESGDKIILDTRTLEYVKKIK